MKIPCSNCNQRLDIPEELTGQTIECPACSTSIVVPVETTAPVQSNLKLSADKPKPPGLSRQQVSSLQSKQGVQTEDVLRNLSSDIAKGSSTAMHVASNLTGTKHRYRETDAAKVSGAIGVILIIGFLLFRFVFSDGYSLMSGIAKTHNRLVAIESEMVDAYNSEDSHTEQAKIVANAAKKLEKIKIENLDKKYQDAYKDQIMALKQWSVALKKGDMEKADEFDNSRIDAVRRLNEIAEKNKY